MQDYFYLVEQTKNDIFSYQNKKHSFVMNEVELSFEKYGCLEWESDKSRSEEQYKRLEKATHEDIKIVKFDEKTISAEMQGTELYKCNLRDCTCYDFSLRKLPCKHIYKLLIELELHPDFNIPTVCCNEEQSVPRYIDEKCEKQLTFVISGALSIERERMEEIIHKMGGKVAGSVSSKTDYLIANEDSGSKVNRAKELGIKIISENDFYKIFFADKK